MYIELKLENRMIEIYLINIIKSYMYINFSNVIFNKK